MLRTISGLTSSRNRLGELHREQDRLDYTLGQLEQERDRLASRRSELEERARVSAGASKTAVAAVENLENRRRELVNERTSLAEDANTAKHETESLGHELWELRHALQGVERELARHTADADQLAGFLPTNAIRGQVSDFLHPENGLAPLLDRVWQEWLELPVVALDTLSDDQLEAASELEGRLRLVLTAGAEPTTRVKVPKGTDDLLALSGADPTNLPWLERTLPRAYRCGDAARAAEIADADPSAIVVDEGGLIRRGRVIETPTAGTSHAGSLQLREDRERLAAEIADMAGRAAATNQRHTEVAARLGQLESDLESLDATLITAEQERARATAVEQSHTADRNRVEAELNAGSSLSQPQDRYAANSLHS